MAGQNVCDRLLLLYDNEETDSSPNELIERQPNFEKQIGVIKFLKSCFKEWREILLDIKLFFRECKKILLTFFEFPCNNNDKLN